MSGGFQYEWWNVEIRFTSGFKCICEVKAKNRENAIKQFKRDFDNVQEIYWETLKLDRTGHQR